MYHIRFRLHVYEPVFRDSGGLESQDKVNKRPPQLTKKNPGHSGGNLEKSLGQEMPRHEQICVDATSHPQFAKLLFWSPTLRTTFTVYYNTVEENLSQ